MIIFKKLPLSEIAGVLHMPVVAHEPGHAEGIETFSELNISAFLKSWNPNKGSIMNYSNFQVKPLFPRCTVQYVLSFTLAILYMYVRYALEKLQIFQIKK